MIKITPEQRLLLNSRLSLEKMRKRGGIEVRANGTLCCPFHDDAHPSAKLFSDNRMWCFSCGKMYDPVAFVISFPLEFPLVKILLKLEGRKHPDGVQPLREEHDFSELALFRKAGMDIYSFEEVLFRILALPQEKENLSV